MAITFAEKKKIQHLLIPALGIVIFITAAVIWWGFFTTGAPSLQEISVPQRRVQVNTGILAHPILDLLDEPREKTKIPSDVGRDNPLLPSSQ
ncbi:MAG: hypothetical protein O3C23_02275 [bacterium]|nr:hypothetical protein [bacterium]